MNTWSRQRRRIAIVAPLLLWAVLVVIVTSTVISHNRHRADFFFEGQPIDAQIVAAYDGGFRLAMIFYTWMLILALGATYGFIKVWIMMGRGKRF